MRWVVLPVLLFALFSQGCFFALDGSLVGKTGDGRASDQLTGDAGTVMADAAAGDLPQDHGPGVDLPPTEGGEDATLGDADAAGHDLAPGDAAGGH